MLGISFISSFQQKISKNRRHPSYEKYTKECQKRIYSLADNEQAKILKDNVQGSFSATDVIFTCDGHHNDRVVI
jgi:hypothetical protein